MARLIFSKAKKRYKNYSSYKSWLEKNSYPMFCGYSWLIDQASIEIDHYKPKEHYPKLKSHPDNLILCTSFCNKSKGDYHPDIKDRNNYKEDQYKVYNYRKEDIGKYIKVKSNGEIYCKSNSYKGRFNFNSRIFRLNDPRVRKIRKEYLETLEELKNLYKIYKTLKKEKETDKKYLKRVEKLFQSRQSACSRRYIFYRLLNIKIPKYAEKLLTNETKAKFI